MLIHFWWGSCSINNEWLPFLPLQYYSSFEFAVDLKAWNIIIVLNRFPLIRFIVGNMCFMTCEKETHLPFCNWTFIIILTYNSPTNHTWERSNLWHHSLLSTLCTHIIISIHWPPTSDIQLQHGLQTSRLWQNVNIIYNIYTQQRTSPPLNDWNLFYSFACSFNGKVELAPSLPQHVNFLGWKVHTRTHPCKQGILVP